MSRRLVGWWRRCSRQAKARLILYPSLIGAFASAVATATIMPDRSFRGALPPMTERQRELSTALRSHVERLAERGERTMNRPEALAGAASTIETALTQAGYTVERLPYDVDGHEVANYEASLAGGSLAGEVVVVGAHYDTAAGAPGADDNASGVAALLEIAKTLAKRSPRRSVRFVAFANEEPPHFWNSSMGSLVYARACQARGDRIVAMLSLETVGYFSDAHGSQKYPPLVSLLYPDQGNFIGFIGNVGSRPLVRESIGAFRRAASFPSEGAALPAFVAGVGWSDHWSFWQAGYPAVMVTDTAPFRNPHYHEPTDRPESLDYERFARVVDGLVAVVEELAR